MRLSFCTYPQNIRGQSSVLPGGLCARIGGQESKDARVRGSRCRPGVQSGDGVSIPGHNNDEETSTWPAVCWPELLVLIVRGPRGRCRSGGTQGLLRVPLSTAEQALMLELNGKQEKPQERQDDGGRRPSAGKAAPPAARGAQRCPRQWEGEPWALTGLRDRRPKRGS